MSQIGDIQVLENLRKSHQCAPYWVSPLLLLLATTVIAVASCCWRCRADAAVIPCYYSLLLPSLCCCCFCWCCCHSHYHCRRRCRCRCYFFCSPMLLSPAVVLFCTLVVLLRVLPMPNSLFCCLSIPGVVTGVDW